MMTRTKVSNGVKGFTLLELMLVVALGTVITALTVPVGIRFFQTQSLDESVDTLLSNLRRAEAQAMFQKNDSAFGIKFLTDSYVLFQGNSYASRIQSEDESFALASGVTASGIEEVVFAKLTGSPSVTGTIAIASGSDSLSLNLNSQGKVERQ